MNLLIRSRPSRKPAATTFLLGARGVSQDAPTAPSALPLESAFPLHRQAARSTNTGQSETIPMVARQTIGCQHPSTIGMIWPLLGSSEASLGLLRSASWAAQKKLKTLENAMFELLESQGGRQPSRDPAGRTWRLKIIPTMG